MLKRRGPFFALAALCLVAAFGLWLSSRQPHSNQTSSYSNQNTAKEIIKHSADERIALYTEVLAWFTGVLAVVSAIQGFFLYRADRTARISADAAKAAIELSRREFNATHRPHFIVRTVERSAEILGGDAIGASVAYINAGSAPGIIKEILWDDNELRPGILEWPSQILPLKIRRIGSGEWGSVMVFSKLGDATAGSISIRNILNTSHPDEPQYHLFCIGYLLYADASGAERRTGFCRRYEVSSDRWVKHENPDYEYSY